MKIAQYEVLGNDAKEMSVPAGTIEPLGCWSLRHARRVQGANRSSHPGPSGTVAAVNIFDLRVASRVQGVVNRSFLVRAFCRNSHWELKSLEIMTLMV